jgi:signal transduction histidine kinase
LKEDQHILKNLSTRKTRYFGLTAAAIFVTAIHALFCLATGIDSAGYAMLIEFGILLICGALYAKGFYDVAGFLTVLSLDILVMFVTKKEGLNSGAIANFFPVIVASGLMVNVKNIKASAIASIFITFIVVAITLFISNDVSEIEILNTNNYLRKWLIIINVLSNIGAVTWFALLIVLIQRKATSKILKALKSTEEASKTKTRFLGVMSHELKTPLNGIIGISNLLETNNSAKDHKEYVQILLENSTAMMRLVDDILQYNKLESNQITLQEYSFNIKKLILDVTKRFQNEFNKKGIALNIAVEQGAIGWFRGDEYKLGLVLDHLLSNALKFTNQGSVTVELDILAKTSNGCQMKFMVNDTGIGIHQDDLPFIFNEFSQADETGNRTYGGTGLGLTICKKLLALMNSKMVVTSSEGMGSVFSFELNLPYAAIVNEEEIKNKVLEPINTPETFKILIAEDNKVNAKVITNFLSKWSIKHDLVENGKEAVDKAKEHNYDVILMDLDMPICDGYTATRNLRKANYESPIIAFTAALINDESKDNLSSIGFDGCIEKPFKPQELHRILENLANKNMYY